MTPRKLFTSLAFAEAVTWTLLIAALVAKYGFDNESFTPVAGGLHGFVFLSYAAVTLFVWANQKWPARTGILGVVLAVVPWATIPFDIEEPLYIADFGKQKVLVNFTVKNGEPKIFWMDIVGDLANLK